MQEVGGARAESKVPAGEGARAVGIHLIVGTVGTFGPGIGGPWSTRSFEAVDATVLTAGWTGGRADGGQAILGHARSDGEQGLGDLRQALERLVHDLPGADDAADDAVRRTRGWRLNVERDRTVTGADAGADGLPRDPRGPSEHSALYADLLASALTVAACSGDPNPLSALSEVLRRRVPAVVHCGDGRDRLSAAEALSVQLAYDVALVRYGRCLGISCGPRDFDPPAKGRRRLEQALRRRGVSLS